MNDSFEDIFDSGIEEIFNSFIYDLKNHIKESVKQELIEKTDEINQLLEELDVEKYKTSKLEYDIKQLKEKLETSRFQECGEPITFYRIDSREIRVCKEEKYSCDELITLTTSNGSAIRMKAANVYGTKIKEQCYAKKENTKIYPVIMDGKKKYFLREIDYYSNNSHRHTYESIDIDSLNSCNMFLSVEQAKQAFLEKHKNNSEWSDELTEKYCKED